MGKEISQAEQDKVIQRVAELKLEPYDTAASLHVFEALYEVDGVKYSFFYDIGGEEPLVEIWEPPIDLEKLFAEAKALKAKQGPIDYSI